MGITTTDRPCVLTGAALQSEARRLTIPGRSRMTADELRSAVAAAVIAEYRAACTAYARDEKGSGPRLRAADDSRLAAGIMLADIPTPDDCAPDHLLREGTVVHAERVSPLPPQRDPWNTPTATEPDQWESLDVYDTSGEACLCGTQVPTPECPITGKRDCRERGCELHYMSAPLRLAPWTSSNGKRKRNTTRRIRNRSI